MKKSKLKSLLNQWNIEENEYQLVPSIKTILLTTNQGLYCLGDKVCFDTDNDLVKIKQYKSEGHNGKLVNFKVSPDKKTLSCDPGKFIYMLNQYATFRKPRLNDVVFSVNKNNEVILKGIIIATNGYNTITLDREFNESENDLAICYSSADIEECIQDPNDKSLFLKLYPLTDLETDIYLDSNLIIGFEMTSTRIGNS